MLRANRLAKYAQEENGDWKFLMWDEASHGPKMPLGSSGFRWGQTDGKWNGTEGGAAQSIRRDVPVRSRRLLSLDTADGGTTTAAANDVRPTARYGPRFTIC
jgi:nitrate reductase alpha subunit